MAGQYSFLIHSSFDKNLVKFRETVSRKDLKSLETQIRKCIADPLRAGKRLHVGKFQILSGRVFRLPIGGPRGYRLIYYVDPNVKVVLGIYISTVKRARLDYHKVGWEKIAEMICEDYVNRNSERFRVYEPK